MQTPIPYSTQWHIGESLVRMTCARYAMAAAASSLSPAAALSEQFSGMTHLNLLNKLSQVGAV